MLKDKTLKSILESPEIAEIAPDAISKWDLSREEFYHWTLREIADKMGWRTLDRGFERLFEMAGRGQYYWKLYSEEERKADPAKENVNFVWFPSDDPEADRRSFILLVPGGGLVNVWNLTEGWPVARQFNELGYHVFILTYRVRVEAAALAATSPAVFPRAAISSASGTRRRDTVPSAFRNRGPVSRSIPSRPTAWRTQRNGTKARTRMRPSAPKSAARCRKPATAVSKSPCTWKASRRRPFSMPPGTSWSIRRIQNLSPRRLKKPAFPVASKLVRRAVTALPTEPECVWKGGRRGRLIGWRV